MSNQCNQSKNLQIKQSIRNTRNRRKNQICKTYKLKIDYSALNSQQRECLFRMFLEAKWLWNDILRWSELNTDNSPFNYKITNTVYVKLPTGVYDERQLNYLHSQMKQALQQQLCSNIRALSSLKKKKLQFPGKLKYKSEIRKLHIKQLAKSFIRRGGHFVKLPNIPGEVRVNGAKQIPKNAELACADLLNTPQGFYLAVVTYIDKTGLESHIKSQSILGIDFGCHTNFTLSTGEKINCIVEESERLKRLQKKLFRQVKGSNNYKRTVHLIQVEYQKLTNKKLDLTNQVVHKFLQYQTVVIQDEQLRNWQKMHHGKIVQHSILGRVKSRLTEHTNVVVLNKWLPTTKLCTRCGKIHDEMRLSDNIFRCDCGVSADRDVHAANTMIWMYFNIGAEHTNLKRVELESLLSQLFSTDKNPSKKHEDLI